MNHEGWYQDYVGSIFNVVLVPPLIVIVISPVVVFKEVEGRFCPKLILGPSVAVKVKVGVRLIRLVQGRFEKPLVGPDAEVSSGLSQKKD